MIDTNVLLSIGLSLISQFTNIVAVPNQAVPASIGDLEKMVVSSPNSPTELHLFHRLGTRFGVRDGAVYDFATPGSCYELQDPNLISKFQGAPALTWTFTDNIFDHSEFHGPNSYHGTGPIGDNHNNVYAGMGSTRLQPADPYSFATTVTYRNGPLGAFYLGEENAALMHTGSQTAAEAGLYHFNTIGTDEIQGDNQVNIGPAYLTLDNAGNPVDSNGDGVPDFIADRNGNGLEDADEMPWTSANSGTLAILSPADGDASEMARVLSSVPPESWRANNPLRSRLGRNCDIYKCQRP